MMDLTIKESRNGFKKFKTTNDACLFFRHRVHPMNNFFMSTEKGVVNGDDERDGDSFGWYFEERDLREAAELFLRLADQLEEARTEGQ